MSKCTFVLAASLWLLAPTTAAVHDLIPVPPMAADPLDGEVEEDPWDPDPGIPTLRFTAAARGMQAAVEIRPPTPAVGELVSVHLTATDARGRSVHGVVGFGSEDDRGDHTIVDCVPKRERGRAEAVEPSSMRETTEFEFLRAGRHPVYAFVFVTGCDDRDVLTVRGSVDVRRSPTLPNLTYPPTPSIEVRPEIVGGWYGREVKVRVDDRDGFLHSATVDMGDGTPEVTVVPYGDPCLDPARYAGYDESAGGTVHYFPGSGTYVVSAVVTTTDCDGRNPQTATASVTVTLPATEQ